MQRAISALGESGDGRWVLSGGMDETLKLWDIASGQEARTISGQGLLWPRAIAVAADGGLAVVTDYQTARTYDLKSGLLLRQLWAQGNSLPLVSRDARWLVGEFSSASTGGSTASASGIEVLDAASGQQAWKVPAGQGARTFALSGDGHWLVTTLESHRESGNPRASAELDLWDVIDRRQVAHCSGTDFATQQRWLAAVSDDGRLLASESVDRNSVDLIDLRRCERVRSLSTQLPPTGGTSTTLSFSPDNSQLAWAVSGGTLRLWQVADGSAVDGPTATAIQWRPDGLALAYGRPGGGAPVVRALPSGSDTAMTAGAAEVNDLALVGEGEAVLAAMQDGSARWWDLASGEIRRDFVCARGAAALSVAVNPGASQVAVGCADGSASLWNVQDAQPTRSLLEPVSQDLAPVIVRYARDGSALLAARRDELAVLDPQTGAARRTITVPPAAAGIATGGAEDPAANWVRAIALHPSEPLVAVGQTRAISIWNYATGERVALLQGSSIFEKMGMGNLQGMAGRGMPMPPGFGGRSGAAGTLAGNPLAAMQALSISGAHSLAYTPDGTRLVSIGPTGRQVWDARTGREINQPAARGGAPDPRRGLDGLMGMFGGGAIGGAFNGRGVTISPDGRLAAQSVGHRVRLFDTTTLETRADLEGHTADVTSLVWSRDGSTLVSGAMDGSVRLWDAKGLKERVALIALGPRDSVAVTPDRYYRATRGRLQGVAFRTRGTLYPFDQFDLRFNRPDIVLAALGRATPELIEGYRHSYERRLRRMGFSEQMLLKDFHLPEIRILTSAIPVTTESAGLSLQVSAHDERVPLDRFMVYVNDVPVFGRAGRAIGGAVHDAQTQLDLPLVSGRNKVQVSVLNHDGIESLRQTLYTTLTTPEAAREVWVVAIGVSHYLNPRYELRYAAKDAEDLAGAFEKHAATGFHLLSITDQKATREGIRAARQWLSAAKTGDLVIVFAAGHGMIDADQNYYYGTYDIDANAPARAGMPFDDFESLLDGIRPLRKLLLVDTCFSGEIDRDELVTSPAASDGSTHVTMRAFKSMRGITVSAGEARPQPAGNLPTYARFQQDWFADLRRGTGAVVISSASGNEFALEGDTWQNGVFTYAVINGLRNGKADANGDGVVSATELEAYVTQSVRELTAGKQNPTVRRENLDFDFNVF